jgi:hypothetical protein
MSTEAIEQKLSELERRLEAIESDADGRKQNAGWLEIFGLAKDDDLLRQAVRLGAEWRERMNAEERE